MSGPSAGRRRRSKPTDDPRSETERVLGVAGTIRLEHPAPDPAGRPIWTSHCSAHCQADGCDATSYVREETYMAFDRAGIRYTVRCEEHAEQRAQRLEVRREHFEDEARDAARDDAEGWGR